MRLVAAEQPALKEIDLVDTEIVFADLASPRHQEAILSLVDGFAAEPLVGDGKPLGDFAREYLIAGLQAHPTTLVFLAWHDEEAVGIATCFRGFSTFAARPLTNISDFYVLPRLRGRGIGRALLAAIEAEARSAGCCKLTLEVQEHNLPARRIYQSCGFAQAVYVNAAGGQITMAKSLGALPA